MFPVSSSSSPKTQILTSSTLQHSSSSSPLTSASHYRPKKSPHLSNDVSGLPVPPVGISTDDKHGIFSNNRNGIGTSQKICTECRKSNDSPSYKRCSECREKRKRYREMSQAKQKLEKANRNLLENGDGMGQYEREIAEAVARQARERLDKLVGAREMKGVPQGRATKKKRKSDSFLLDQQTKEKDLPAKKKRKSDVTDLQMRQQIPVMQEMFKKLKEEERIRLSAGSETNQGGLVQNTSYITAIYTDKRGRIWTEFQNATEMYDYLRSYRLPKMCSENEKTNLKNFRGCYSIIAKPDIDETKRTSLVVREVRKIGKVPFYHKIPTYDCGSKITFRCTCLASATDTSIVMANSSFNSTSSKVPLPSSPAKNEACGGEVVVRVEKDASHPIFPGQKIYVEVRHA